MLRTLVRRAHVHKPGFRFPDRKAPKESHTPHPHPAAPSSIVESFDHFQKVFSSGPHFHPEKLQSQSGDNSGSKGSGLLGDVDMQGREVAEDVHLLPERFWRTPALQFSDEEIEAVMSGGAN
ncbi:Ribosomal protein S36, mitochondrial [Kalmanozyma brasiliensis GHG001]|uniref:Ribosomal protein S36, mitochondrial n=1 Tax=Kalmanozyma brasiliensis (strain GHG001) TaxID=1365824 RepID=V5E8V7_KALBG|nr:Ribosomal protein S36, mitochondrial [Kalmanozyma brasiliensis GHG001]EST06771.1 Ribosomal protein S36, mitochondrial [Kalmanozyma brasiliensis GHG001]